MAATERKVVWEMPGRQRASPGAFLGYLFQMGCLRVVAQAPVFPHARSAMTPAVARRAPGWPPRRTEVEREQAQKLPVVPDHAEPGRTGNPTASLPLGGVWGTHTAESQPAQTQRLGIAAEHRPIRD
jgi:hypothetical protein